jgi:pimeloyl-ACP methyl ester carboxylesterase
MELQLSMLAVEYPGYGLYEGACNSDQMIKDAYSVLKYATKLVPEKKIIVIGRSIGSGLAVEMGTKYSGLRALVLISAFTSL